MNIYNPLDGLDVQEKEEHVPEMHLGLQYLTPEFIEEGQTGPEADLWSLGLIIYYMLTGRDAFVGQSKEEVCLKIMAGDFLHDEDIEQFGDTDEEKEAAHDLIIKLTQMLPHMRLGSGEEDTPQSMSELKGHRWFTQCGCSTKTSDKTAEVAQKDAMKQDVTKFYELPIPNWPKNYKMKYVCPRLEKYYDEQSFSTPSRSRNE